MSDNSDNTAPEPNSEELIPERLLECSECKKPIFVRYTEIIGKSIKRFCMCYECPELERRLKGNVHYQIAGTNIEVTATDLACGNCGITLEALRVGHPLGCSNCYEVFGDMLLAEMGETNKIPARLDTSKKSSPIHLGRSPGITQEMSSSLRLLALNEALTETLKREDYEQAAWLRDQIKALTESEPSEKSDDEQKNE